MHGMRETCGNAVGNVFAATALYALRLCSFVRVIPALPASLKLNRVDHRGRSVLYRHRLPILHVAGITPHQDNSWMSQVARNITDVNDGFPRDKRYLILHRHTNTRTHSAVLTRDGVRVIRLPRRGGRADVFRAGSDLARRECREIVIGCRVGGTTGSLLY
jgi:hypothetical protein